MLRRSQTRIDLLFTMSKIPQARPLGARMRSDVFADVCFWRSGLSDRWSARLRSLSHAGHASPFGHPAAAPRVARRAKRGGARRDRTADLIIANDALSQLSYGPEMAAVKVNAAASGCAIYSRSPGQVKKGQKDQVKIRQERRKSPFSSAVTGTFPCLGGREPISSGEPSRAPSPPACVLFSTSFSSFSISMSGS